jgi:hypothetical protein
MCRQMAVPAALVRIWTRSQTCCTTHSPVLAVRPVDR